MMTRQRLIFVLAGGAALVLALCWVAHAQKAGGAPALKVGQPEKLGPHDPNPARKPDEIRIKHAEHTRVDTRRDMYDLWGGVEFQSKDMTVVCDEARYDGKNDTAACAGHLKVSDAESVITGATMQADFNTERALITGKVTIVTTKEVKQQAEGGGAAQPEKRVTTITCDKVDYYFGEGKRRAIAVGHIKAVQDRRTVIAQKADYDREKDIITLTDDVTITQENGNAFHCKKATISGSEEWVQMEGEFTGTVIRDKKKGATGTKAGG